MAVLAGGTAAGIAPAIAAAAPAAAVPARLPGQAVLVPRAGLSAVAIVSGRLAWAVGSRTIGNINSGDVQFAPLIMRWNGAAWAKVPGPVPATGGDLLEVAATSAGNAWAVGNSGGTPGIPSRALIEHWDGTAWKQVPSAGRPRSQTLSDVAASSARSAWAVGSSNTGGDGGSGLILAWNGASWG